MWSFLACLVAGLQEHLAVSFHYTSVPLLSEFDLLKRISHSTFDAVSFFGTFFPIGTKPIVRSQLDEWLGSLVPIAAAGSLVPIEEHGLTGPD